MSGKQRLPGGEPRKASQRTQRLAGSRPTTISPTWHAGEAVRWKGRAGVFRRNVGDREHAPRLDVRRAVIARITIPEPAQDR